MKKRLALLLVLSILLCGCAREPVVENTTGQTTTTTPATPDNPEPEQDFGIYEPESSIEIATDGAVKMYNLKGWDYHGALVVGDGLLMVSGERDCVLTYLSPDGTESTLILKDQFLFPEEFTLIPERDCVAYYDMDDVEMVLLDTALKEVQRIALPDTVRGMPLVTSDWSRIYYMTDTELRYLDIETGIDRLLKEISFDYQFVRKLHFDDSVVECMVDDAGFSKSLMISSQTGEVLYESDDLPSIKTYEDRYFALYYENDVLQYLFGDRKGPIQCLNVEMTVYLEALEMWCVVSCEETEEGSVLSCYDLATGTRSSAVTLPSVDYVYQMTADAERNAIWFIVENEKQESKLYCWDLSKSKTGDETTHTAPFYTSDNPDKEGLLQLNEWAREIGRKYGVRIWIGEEAAQTEPSDYTFEPQYQVAVYQRYLEVLDKALGRYPEGFLRKLGSSSTNGKLTISLVKGAYGDNLLGSLETADGVHFYNYGSEYIALVMGESFEGTLYHELSHSIDTYVMSRSNLYDYWDDLNPAGFEYDNDYVANQFREDYEYLEDDRWFIDMYSMSYAKEDRARIMEYAMGEGNAHYFTSPHMQAKLAKLSEAIRTAFGIKSSSVVLTWEQYLK